MGWLVFFAFLGKGENMLLNYRNLIRWLTVVLLMVIAFGISYMAAGIMGSSNDAAWHTVNGIQIIKSKHIILTDRLTWKTPGHVWNDPEWLFDVILAATYLKFGWFGVRLFVVFWGELLVLLLGIYAVKRQKSSMVITFGIILLLSISPVYSARPQIVSFIMFALAIYITKIARLRNLKILLAFIPFFIGWNNAHGSAILFIGLLVLECLESRKIWPYILIFCGLITLRPGSTIQLANFMHQQINPIALSISEWQSPNFHVPVELIELAFFGVSSALIASKATLKEKIWLALGWSAYFFSVRFYPYAAILTWFVLMDHLEISLSWENVMTMLATGLTILMVWESPKFYRTEFTKPVVSGAAEYCLQHGIHNVVNEYSIGGELEWYGLKTIADGRAFWIGEKWFSTYFATEIGRYPMAEFLKNEAPDVETVMWLDNTPISSQMELMGNWKKVYDDRHVSVWEKTTVSSG